MPKQVTDSSFQEDVLNASGPVVVDFWAEWCGPCKQIAPALEEISAEMGDKVTIAKVNIDDNPEAPSTYGVRGIPTLIMFKDGGSRRYQSWRFAQKPTGAVDRTKPVILYRSGFVIYSSPAHGGVRAMRR
jgi:thioredoxin 1